tara:strand:- start:3 stop:245 length:243 start_codon:yes stop_codon:yes gene_type:complete
MKPKKPLPKYTFGQVFINPYLGNKTTEVLDANKKRAGWLWTHTDGRVIVSPYLGFYVWFDEVGKEWTTESGAEWLVQHRK